MLSTHEGSLRSAQGRAKQGFELGKKVQFATEDNIMREENMFVKLSHYKSLYENDFR